MSSTHKRKLHEIDDSKDEMEEFSDRTPAKKRRRIAAPLSSSTENQNINIVLSSTILCNSPSEFSCAESSQFSVLPSSQEQENQSQQSSQFTVTCSECSDSPNRLAQNIPSVLLQEILSYNTPFELSICAVVNKFYHQQCTLHWQRLQKCTISPKQFPSLIDDDYDSQFEYNPTRHPHRTHSTLNWIIHKLNICESLHTLKIQRTMMNGQMFETLLQNCPHLTSLHLDENPWIFLLGRNKTQLADSMDVDKDNNDKNHNCNQNELAMDTGNLFERLPTFKLQTFIIELMYMNLTDLTFSRLLSSSKQSLQTLILKRRAPFSCSYCKKSSLCKWHKCEDCHLRSYCSRACQSDDWWQHQYVCSYHDPTGDLQRLQSGSNLNGGFLDTICSFENLVTLSLSWSYNVHHTALTMISTNCVNLEHVMLNGCDVTDQGVMALASNLKHIKTLHCRAARYVTDRSIRCLYTNCCKTLQDLDVSRCCLVTKQACLDLVKRCAGLVKLSMACAIKRGGWIWTMDDELAKEIVVNLKGLKWLEYITADNGHLSDEYKRKLYAIPDIVIQTISTDKQCELRQMNGHLQVVITRESANVDPVLMQRIVNGQVVEGYSHQFRR